MNTSPSPPVIPVLDTSRLRLRPLHIDDAEALHEALADPLVMRHWNQPPAADIDDTRQRLTASLDVSTEWHAVWAITRLTDRRAIGLVNYHHREAWNQRIEIGYLLSRAYWRQGFMREALTALLDHCFGAFAVHRVEAMVEPGNLPSRQLLEGMGFVCEGGLLRDRLKVGDSYRSVMPYGLLQPDWAAQRRC